MNQQDNTVISLILYGQKKEQELVLYAHRLRQYHEFASLKSIKEASTESASQSSLTEDRTLEEDMIEQLTETPIIMMPLPKPSSSQRPNRSHSQNTLPVRSQNNIYYANKNLFKQCIKHEFTRQGIQDAELSQVVYHDLIYHYKDKLHAHLLPEQQIQVSSKTFIDFHVNFKAMLSIK
ncbi:hypothetical protein BD560DRAFT_69314 [Blakeslea trispora]|nr:hypothetical protein BD560DRAFT_69314 [Blakeslea trispora]